MSDNKQIIALSIDTPLESITAMYSSLYEQLVKSESGFFLSIAGFDDDPRELWQIPEVVEFFKNLIEIGFITLLVPDIIDIPKGKRLGLGALEVWMYVNHNGEFELDIEKYRNEFFPALMKSNETLERYLATPDGMHRYNPSEN